MKTKVSFELSEYESISLKEVEETIRIMFNQLDFKVDKFTIKEEE